MTSKKYFSKFNVSEHEAKMALMMSNVGVAPHTILNTSGNKPYLRVEKYRYVLQDYTEELDSIDDTVKEVYRQAELLLDQMHELQENGYLHGDAHEGNIVFNIIPSVSVKLIDFGNTVSIADLTDEKKHEICDFWNIAHTTDIDVLKAHEKSMFKQWNI